MMRRLLWNLCVIILCLGFAGLGVFNILAGLGPFHIGEGELYTLQRWAEKEMVNLDPSPGGKARHLLDMAARRSRDLEAQVGSTGEMTALAELGRGCSGGDPGASGGYPAAQAEIAVCDEPGDAGFHLAAGGAGAGSSRVFRLSEMAGRHFTEGIKSKHSAGQLA